MVPVGLGIGAADGVADGAMVGGADVIIDGDAVGIGDCIIMRWRMDDTSRPWVFPAMSV